MRRIAAFCLVLLFAYPGFASLPAGATESHALRVDAGDSQLALDGATILLTPRIQGGAAPFTYLWTWAGAADRFGDATSAQTTFATTGMAPQDVVLIFTVTDRHGDVASDTVRHRIDGTVVIRRNITFFFGVPDELAGGSSDARQTTFLLPAGLERIVATLSWPEPATDLDFELRDPSGNPVTGDAGKTLANPEVVTVEAPVAGLWTARITPFLTGPTTATLLVEGAPRGTLPGVHAGGSYAFGRFDPQKLTATTSGGSAPLSLAWDLDADGFYETPGATVTPALPLGDHTVRVRATDAAGFEVGASALVRVRPSDVILRLGCGGDPSRPNWTMEYTSSGNTCWVHGGHHTYYTGSVRFALRNLTGFLFTVEQQLSPPTEHLVDAPGATPLHLQVSLDGRTWTEVAHGEYRFLPDVIEGERELLTRQRVDVTAEGAGQPFRFIRIHEPLSAAQGLSGYLDHSEFDVEADLLMVGPPPTLVAQQRAYSCATDIMEDFFLAHPCWFGGINRWDAPSFWHTYVLGEAARPTRVQGTFVLAPWRTDDWMQANATTNATGVAARVQTSDDGVNWTDVAWVQTTFNVPTTFDVTLDGSEARFVRLYPQGHARFDQTAEFAPNHHPKGFFVDSSLLVDGLLPVL